VSDDALARWRTSSAAATQTVAEAIGRVLRAGDVLVLTGGLGAGKTTFTQGLAHGLGVRGPITSPTFVVAREHPSLVGGPHLVHVDAYRLGGRDELDDLDLDADLESAVTVVEWGAGLAEALSDDYLEIVLTREDEGDDPTSGGAEAPRTIVARGHGDRWVAAWPEIAALT
jgi:tRNA threonylcarbamoyladenosine biosynthesis protein TsaE